MPELERTMCPGRRAWNSAETSWFPGSVPYATCQPDPKFSFIAGSKLLSYCSLLKAVLNKHLKFYLHLFILIELLISIINKYYVIYKSIANIFSLSGRKKPLFSDKEYYLLLPCLKIQISCKLRLWVFYTHSTLSVQLSITQLQRLLKRTTTEPTQSHPQPQAKE